MNSKIPTIDISALYGNNLKSKQNVAAQINAACTGCGFFQISNHDLLEANQQLALYSNSLYSNLMMLYQENQRSEALNNVNPEMNEA